jgi:hypothetical protein
MARPSKFAEAERLCEETVKQHSSARHIEEEDIENRQHQVRSNRRLQHHRVELSAFNYEDGGAIHLWSN